MNFSHTRGSESARRAFHPEPEREERLVFMKRLIHDLNNALSVITIDVGLLQAEGGGRGPEDATELFDEMADAAAKASLLTGQLRRCVTEAVDSLPDVDQGGRSRRR
jgi:hypothetical protein